MIKCQAYTERSSLECALIGLSTKALGPKLDHLRSTQSEHSQSAKF